MEPPPSIKKEKEKIVTSDTILDLATSADLYKLQTPRPSTRSTPAPAPTLKSSFSANLMLYQQATFAPSPAYISYTEEMEAIGQGWVYISMDDVCILSPSRDLAGSSRFSILLILNTHSFRFYTKPLRASLADLHKPEHAVKRLQLLQFKNPAKRSKIYLFSNQQPLSILNTLRALMEAILGYGYGYEFWMRIATRVWTTRTPSSFEKLRYSVTGWIQDPACQV